jgi:hypothetical protein
LQNADSSLPAAGLSVDGLPGSVLDMQRRAETLFIAFKTAEHIAISLRGQRPRPFVPPARPGLVQRALMRAVPWMARRWQVRILRDSGLFDAAWYLAQYPDVQAAGVDPVRHFVIHGAADGRDPGPGFSSAHYLRLYPDVKAAGLNPLVHYLTAGWAERRSIHPLMPQGQA